MFEFPVERPSPKRGHGASPGRNGSPPRRKKGSPRRRGPPRRRYVRLGEPENGIYGLSGPPRRGCEACVDGLFRVGLLARFVIVFGLLRSHCMTCLRVSLLD